ncbi:hypothetical protein M0813_29050 [Anaeramoeba flamelloides]|uniref:Uncharacterized protein n=1 Tax=Anaeramoeba flamelloides TaxID=1746091 RepID=A0ABQ8XSI9_9EUKA|nr:hypothetical protein M0813_29050 [Anaeramoeba flamelloides]
MTQVIAAFAFGEESVPSTNGTISINKNTLTILEKEEKNTFTFQLGETAQILTKENSDVVTIKSQQKTLKLQFSDPEDQKAIVSQITKILDKGNTQEKNKAILESQKPTEMKNEKSSSSSLTNSENENQKTEEKEKEKKRKKKKKKRKRKKERKRKKK